MEPALKQRLLGAAVLVALAALFLPYLVAGPTPESGASSVPLKVPPTPAEVSGDTKTIELPLAAPATPMPARAVTAPPADDAPATSVPSATAAGGDYAVHFGSYATPADAGRVVAALANAGLKAWQEPAPLGTRTVHRVRIGPFATAADAEAARLAATRLGNGAQPKVIVLDAGNVAAPPASTPTAKPAPPTPATPAAATGTAAAPTSTRPAPTPAAAAQTPTTTVTAGTDRATPAGSPPPSPPEPPKPATPPAASNIGYAIQLGAFANPDEAARLRDRARAAGFAAFVEQVRTDHGTLNRVRVGPFVDRAAADAARAQVQGKLGVAGIVRPHP